MGADKPWVGGPQELLEHGLQHLRESTDFDTRIAMISIDNAVELMIKVYLGLPKRITGIHLARAKYDEICKSFTTLIEALEELASDKITGLELGEIEWFHRLRDELYHQGNGTTVERQKVEVYAGIATVLMQNLFGVPHDDWHGGKPGSEAKLIIKFLEDWANVGEEILLLAVDQEDNTLVLAKDFIGAERIILRFLHDEGKVPKDVVIDYDDLFQIRYDLVYRDKMPSRDDFEKYQRMLERLKQTLRALNQD